MNRFTAIYRPEAPQATPGELRKALEDLLARELPPGKYRLAALGEMPDGLLAAELACPWAKDVLRQRLAEAGGKTGYALEKVGWGWLQSGRMVFDLVDESSGSLLYDPLMDEAPQGEERRSYHYSGMQALSLAVVLGGITAALAVVIGSLVNDQVASWARTNMAFLALGFLLWWMVLRLIGAMVTPWTYLRRIDVDGDGLKLFGLLARERRAAWGEIDELQYVDQRILLLLGNRVLSIQLRDRLGMKDRLTLVRTILMRADLLFVGGRVGEFTYRKFDA
jgi:hypothetical protein